MSTYIQWTLYGKDAGSNPLPKEKAYALRDALNDEVTEWHGDDPDGELIAQFLTTYNDGYSSVTEIIGNFAKTVPNCMFQLFCHNEDEDLYQQIHFCGYDRENLDGQIIYDEPQRIIYDSPAPVPKIMVILQGGSVQGVSSDSIRDADVTIVDLDLSKLDASTDEERTDTLAWISEKLAFTQNMNVLYGRRVEEG